MAFENVFFHDLFSFIYAYIIYYIIYYVKYLFIKIKKFPHHRPGRGYTYGPEGGAFSYEMPLRFRNHPRPIKPILTNTLTYTLTLALALALTLQRKKHTECVSFLWFD